MRKMKIEGDWQMVLENLFIEFLYGDLKEIHVKKIEKEENAVFVKYL